MKIFHNKSSGFTLIELLVVMSMLAVVVAAVYSLYLTHMRTAYSHDEVVEVEQNLRIAMDAITRDLKMAGLLVPKGATPATTVFPISNNTANSLQINSTSPNGGFARITPSAVANGTYQTTDSAFILNVDSSEAVDGFNINDKVRILSNYDKSQPLGGFLGAASSLVVTAVHRGDLNASPPDKPSITVEIYNVSATGDPTTPTGAVPADVVLQPGYLITKAQGVAGSDSITYALVSGAANNCPVNQCLARILPAPQPPEIVASNLTQLQFNYMFDNTDDVQTVKAVRVTLTGATVRNTGAPGWTPQTRSMTSIIKLRN
jgi:prepilin-type N-terminal cleavage/methylation domain-containing protein